MDDEEEPEFIRADTWMQSMVPSLPKGCAIFCLVCNVIIPGLGTFTGGVISCCYGRPRIDFRPARYRCPASFVVMLVGVAQLLCTAFFLVGWLWSIIWGFLMLNLSDPKFRTLAALPPPLENTRAKTPIVKVDQPEEDVPAAKKNFGRLITKARENKDQALGLVPPDPPSNPPSDSSSFGGSLLSRIPSIRCSDSSKATEAASNNRDKSRSESKQNLLAVDSGLESVKVVGGSRWRPALSAHRMFHRWKRAVISKVPKPGIGCASRSGNSSSEVSLMSDKDAVSNPTLSLILPVTSAVTGGRRNSVFSEIISVTPATPIRSRPLSAIGSKTPPENIATVNPVVVHVAQSETKHVSAPNVENVRSELNNKSEKKKETIVSKAKPKKGTEIELNQETNEWKANVQPSTKENENLKRIEQKPNQETNEWKANVQPSTKENVNLKTIEQEPNQETNEWKANVQPSTKETESLKTDSKQKPEVKTNEWTVETNKTDPKVDPVRSIPKIDIQKPGVDPMKKTGSNSDRTKSKLESKPNSYKSESPMETTNKVVAKVGPLSARSVAASSPGLTLNPTELFQRQMMKPRMKQSAVYHYDV